VTTVYAVGGALGPCHPRWGGASCVLTRSAAGATLLAVSVLASAIAPPVARGADGGAAAQATPPDLGFDGLWGDLAFDLTAILLLAYAIYYRRHRRRDLLMAFVCFNVALFAVVKVLSSGSGTTSLALGLGLMGALSIIRLRSQELSYVEVAYFFSALALALVNGIAAAGLVYAATLNAGVLAAMFTMDHLGPQRRVQRLSLVLDDVYADEPALRAEIERRLGAEVVGVSIEEIDYVRDVTRLEAQIVPGSAPVVPAEPVPSRPRWLPVSEPVAYEQRNGR
jgi:hypothetical protein